jgi:hypothetical protein
MLTTGGRWDLWGKKFMTVVDKHAPFKSKRLRNKNNPWIKTIIDKLSY